jgi:ABC-2 type transport system ATP-binding protein
MTAFSATGVGRRFGHRWALRHIDADLPEGAIAGLVGPNGAGKSTLLHLMTGLLQPSEGCLRVLGIRPGSPAALPDVAFVAQDAPLPRRLRLGQLVAVARRMNVRWDDGPVRDRCVELGLDERQRVESLSGGQRAQLALSLALAKRPRLLVLDEPVASLDPLARRTFLAAVMAAVAERELTVVLSTHLLDDLERVCDHLVLLQRGEVRIGGSIDDLVDRHRILVGPPGRSLPRGATTIGPGRAGDGHQRLVRLDGPVLDPVWKQQPARLEEIVLAHLAAEPAVRRLEVA